MVICASRGVWVERSMKLCNKHKVLATIVLRNFSSERKNGSTNHRKVPTKKYFFFSGKSSSFFSSGICSEMFRNVPRKKRKKIFFCFSSLENSSRFSEICSENFSKCSKNVPKMFRKMFSEYFVFRGSNF